ncbi:PREDICTED: uncharacterized protein LOC101310577 [Fragaria vesca subsp. vesca]
MDTTCRAHSLFLSLHRKGENKRKEKERKELVEVPTWQILGCSSSGSTRISSSLSSKSDAVFDRAAEPKLLAVSAAVGFTIGCFQSVVSYWHSFHSPLLIGLEQKTTTCRLFVTS